MAPDSVSDACRFYTRVIKKHFVQWAYFSAFKHFVQVGPPDPNKRLQAGLVDIEFLDPASLKCTTPNCGCVKHNRRSADATANKQSPALVEILFFHSIPSTWNLFLMWSANRIEVATIVSVGFDQPLVGNNELPAKYRLCV